MKIIALLLVAMLCSGCSNREARTSIDPLMKFARTYDPYTEGNGLCESTPSVPPEVKAVLRNRPVDDEFKKYVSIIFLKLYNCQFDRYGQSFRVPTGPLYTAYRKVMGDVSREFVSSADVLIWLKLNQGFLMDPEIKRLVEITHDLYEARETDGSSLPRLNHWTKQ